MKGRLPAAPVPGALRCPADSAGSCSCCSGGGGGRGWVGAAASPVPCAQGSCLPARTAGSAPNAAKDLCDGTPFKGSTASAGQNSPRPSLSLVCALWQRQQTGFTARLVHQSLNDPHSFRLCARTVGACMRAVMCPTGRYTAGPTFNLGLADGAGQLAGSSAGAVSTRLLQAAAGTKRLPTLRPAQARHTRLSVASLTRPATASVLARAVQAHRVPTSANVHLPLYVHDPTLIPGPVPPSSNEADCTASQLCT